MDELIRNIIVAISPILAAFLISLIGEKVVALKNNKKLAELGINETLIVLAEQVVVDVVIAINQTIVDAAKASGTFNKQKAEEVFYRAKNEILLILSPAMKESIKLMYGNFDVWLENKIEAVVNEQKIIKPGV